MGRSCRSFEVSKPLNETENGRLLLIYAVPLDNRKSGFCHVEIREKRLVAFDFVLAHELVEVDVDGSA